LSALAELERPLPTTLPLGKGTAVFCTGHCNQPGRRLRALEILVDGEPHRAAAFGMPRPDLPPGHSGFWGTVPVGPRDAPGIVTVSLRIALSGGSIETVPLGEIQIVESDAPARPARAASEEIAVCMATFEPDAALFARQIESLRAQTDQRWSCVISDDCSAPQSFERLVEIVGGDDRFTVSRSEQRLGFYRNFERALQMAPPEAGLVALCDQDDVWRAEKLAVLRDAIGGAALAYCDQRLVTADGAVLRETMWRGRRNNHDSLASMVIANTITGAAMLLRRELLELALPFPDTPGFQFHDHWLATVGLAAGPVAYVDRPLYDYVQHSGAVFGDLLGGGTRPAPKGTARAQYFYGYLAREVQAQALLVRCDRRLTARKRRALRWLIACDRSLPALAWLALRPLRGLLGRSETLGTELALAQGLLWRRLASFQARLPRMRRGPFADASAPPPQEFVQSRLRRWRAVM
jgi:glycosyltransferase involved in cell wall biosynthesis